MRKISKRVLSGLICLLLLTALLPLPAAEAASAKVLDSGKCGENVTWTLTDDAVLTISGTGPMYYFHTPPVEGYNGPNAPWYVWGGEYVAIKEVVIESGVTSIGGFAFYDCHNLTKVTIPESVTSIDKYAFTYCHNLSHITIPASVKKIGEKAFVHCSSLTSITFLGDASSIESSCFEGVTATVYSPCAKGWGSEEMKNYSGTLTWAGHVYSDYAITQAATCTENALAVGTCPDCGATADLTVPESATGHSFDQKGICTACSEQISLTVDLIGRPYYNGGGLDYASVTVYADGQSLGSVSVEMFVSADYERKTFPYSPHKTYTFVWTSYPYYDDVFFAYFLGDKVLTYGYPEYQSIGKVSYTIERTEEHQYERVTTPATCTTQGSIADVCTICGIRTNISTIPATGHSYTSEITTVPTCTGKGVRTFLCSACGASYTESVPATGHHYDADGLCVDCGIEFQLAIYMTDTYGDSWNGSAIQVCTGDTLLTEVSLPSGTLNGNAEVPFIPGQTYQLKWKSSAADNECGFKITLNGEVLVAGQGSSYSDGQLLCTFKNACAHVYQTSVTPPTCTESGFTTGTCTFCDYSGIIDTTPATGHSYVDGVCTVCHEEGDLANGSCGDDLRWRLYDDGRLTITGTGPMKDYSMPEEGSEPDTPWYSYKQLITNVVVETGATTIGEYAFHGFSNMTDVTIPESVTTIGKLAFYNCTGLTDMTIPQGVTTIGSAAFRRCSNLTNVTIPEGLTTIGKIAFFDCTGLTDVTIPGSVTSIGEYAFGNCTGLTTVTFSGSAPAMDSTCFKNITATAVYPCNDETWTDSVNQNYGGTVIWEANHSFGDYIPGQDATCTEDGLTDGVKCALCNEVLTAQQVIPAIGHDYWVTQVSGTCTNYGYDLHQCQNCGDSFYKNLTSPTGHHYENGICTVCGEGNVTVLPGDVNGDGQQTIADVSILYAHTKGTVLLDTDSLSYADVNGDGNVDIADTARLYAHVKGTNPLN